MFFADTLGNVARGFAAVWRGDFQQLEQEGFRESGRRLIFYFFTFLYALLTFRTITHAADDVPIGYTWSELLLNYQAGFVRRGLFGEVLFQLQPYISSVIAATAVIFCAYCLFAFLTLKLLNKAPLSVSMFFFFSPAAFLFPIYDPRVFGRKEIFSLCAFALTNIVYLQASSNKTKILLFLVLYTVAIFIHDAALFFAPLSACILVLSIKERSGYFRVKILFSLFLYVFAIGCFLLLTVNPDYDASGIVKSWKPYFPGIELDGALRYLNKPLGTFFAETTGKIANFKDFTKPFMIDFCWAGVPVLLLVLRGAYIEFLKNLGKSDPLTFAAVIGSFLAPFFLFFFQDWGRWIHLITLHTFIFLVMLNNLKMVEYKAMPPPSKYCLTIYSIFFVYYAVFWSMPHLR